jgi:hypothetical protein
MKMPLPPDIITKDIRSFVMALFDSLASNPSLLQKDTAGIYDMFTSLFYPLSKVQQIELDDCISQELLKRYYNYETALAVHPEFKMMQYTGTYYKMDDASESGYFVTKDTWYIVEECTDHWEMYPTNPRILLENNGITRIYD